MLENFNTVSLGMGSSILTLQFLACCLLGCLFFPDFSYKMSSMQPPQEQLETC